MNLVLSKPLTDIKILIFLSHWYYYLGFQKAIFTMMDSPDIFSIRKFRIDFDYPIKFKLISRITVN